MIEFKTVLLYVLYRICCWLSVVAAAVIVFMLFTQHFVECGLTMIPTLGFVCTAYATRPKHDEYRFIIGWTRYLHIWDIPTTPNKLAAQIGWIEITLRNFAIAADKAIAKREENHGKLSEKKALKASPSEIRRARDEWQNAGLRAGRLHEEFLDVWDLFTKPCSEDISAILTGPCYADPEIYRKRAASEATSEKEKRS
jgi:hypothetical protein